MTAEKIFRLLHSSTVNEQQFSPSCVRQSIDDRSSQELSQIIIDECTSVSPECGNDYHPKDIESSVVCHPRSWRNDRFRGKRNERAFNGHSQEDDPIVEVIEHPSDDFAHRYLFILSDEIIYQPAAFHPAAEYHFVLRNCSLTFPCADFLAFLV